ncbi:MAG: hypothetical protein SPF56_06515 [Bacteroidaceae bacterium]|nr:hypothetical protein [Prevotellaceae bacterium]MDY5632127.1 hypothetical protein [Bacteroidaceae bacterium]
MVKKVFLLLLLTGCVLSAYAQSARMQRVYMFGFAASLGDSVAFLTDVQTMDSAYVHYNGFLADRSMYSAQLQQAMATRTGKENMTCAVFFGTKKNQVEKKYLKLKHRYGRKNGVVVQALGLDQFRFLPVAYVEPTSEAKTTKEAK